MINLTEEQKNNIISECINTRKTFRRISRENGISIQQLYSIIEDYCKANGYVSLIRNIDNERFLKNAREIEEWCKENGRNPKRIKESKEKEKETRLAYELSRIRFEIMKKYENKRLDEIEDANDREIVRIIRELDKKYKTNHRLNSEGECIRKKNAREIEEWCKENGRKPKRIKESKEKEKETRLAYELSRIRFEIMKKHEDKRLDEIEDANEREIVRIIRDIDKKYKTSNRFNSDGEYILLKNTREIEEWSEENGRKPKRIKGVKVVKKGEKETEQQKEQRLFHALIVIRGEIMKKYENQRLDKIEDADDREIVRIIRELDEKYPKYKKEKKESSGQIKPTKQRDKLHFVKTVGNEKMKKMIVNLIKTKNATEEQIKVIADFYGIDMGKVINEKDER